MDGKVLTGWNGLVIGALARAGAVLGEPAWVAAAASAGEHVLTVNRGTSGQLVRSSLDGAAADAVATSADVGLLADGLFALALATGDASWATRAQEVLAETPVPDPVLAGQGIPRGADDGDGDLPSGPAALASAHLTAWRLGAGSSTVRARRSWSRGWPVGRCSIRSPTARSCGWRRGWRSRRGRSSLSSPRKTTNWRTPREGRMPR
ncbi:hypothetical protein [Microbacterium suwonense]|uniref:Uncharacterized protein n=1 Tax=Microbacterium suwonense TaxID=683047 RepID=A0ABN6X112_9MICO|nr:hypothetical protein [Microbacterium suwonense]BDZ37673.1 hypothetical protein GCM10025863_02870 [Microbacterium suwonense]